VPSTPSSPAARDAAPTFEDDVAFLTAHGHVVTLESKSGGRVAVSVKYQGRVMTSAVAPGGRSLGFVHRAFIENGQTGTPFDNYGGEDRFWLGPEGGQYGLFFPPGAAFAFDAWQTPRDMQQDPWTIASRSATELGLTRTMKLVNWTGTPFAVDVSRTIRVLDAAEAAKHLGAAVDAGIAWIAFESVNRITNAGDATWEPDKGLVSVWILGMFAPAPDAHIVVPFDPLGQGAIVNDRYFGKVPPERLVVREKEGVVVLTADGHYRSKIGVGPGRARQVAGSYSASENLLTLVQYDESPRGKRYVNSMWEQQQDPYGGDVVNAYNDGPTAPGKPSLGGFYELETSSPAAALGPRESLVHTHRTFHFVGPREALEPIARRLLGVSLAALH
jgi:hypothetical protein